MRGRVFLSGYSIGVDLKAEEIVEKAPPMDAIRYEMNRLNQLVFLTVVVPLFFQFLL